MILKHRTKSLTYKVLESLNFRMTLSAEDKKRYSNQVKGYQGELWFDSFLEPYHENSLILNDLNLSSSGNAFQIDTLVITNSAIYFYEIKNYSGTYYCKNQLIYGKSGHLLLNPSVQISRSQVLLHNLTYNLGFRLPVIPFILFVNPNFYIDSLPLDHSILFPNQLHTHFSTLLEENSQPSKKSYAMAEKILGLNTEHYRPDKLPSYSFDELKKGVLCPHCSSKEHANTRQNRICSACGHKESIMTAIERNIAEAELLFPETPLTTILIHEWCGKIYSKERIRNVLKANYQSHLTGPRRYYTKPEFNQSVKAAGHSSIEGFPANE